MERSADTEAPSEWIELQSQLRSRVVSHDRVRWRLPDGRRLGSCSSSGCSSSDDATEEAAKPLLRLGGVDVSFMKGSDQAVASLVVLDAATKQVLHQAMRRVTLDLEYIPGFLAFREVPHLKRLIDELQADAASSDLLPDIILVDGNGVFHPRGCGLASHLGVVTGIPTIGVSKTLMHVDGINKETLPRLLAEREPEADHVLLRGDSGVVHGAAFFPTKTIKNPIFVSVGHDVSLETALEICRYCSHYRVPEPVRQADLRSREEIRAWEASGGASSATDSERDDKGHADLEER